MREFNMSALNTRHSTIKYTKRNDIPNIPDRMQVRVDTLGVLDRLSLRGATTILFDLSSEWRNNDTQSSLWNLRVRLYFPIDGGETDSLGPHSLGGFPENIKHRLELIITQEILRLIDTIEIATVTQGGHITLVDKGSWMIHKRAWARARRSHNE